MGLFNWIKCLYPLPGEERTDIIFQTKDIEPNILDNYRIEEDGTLSKEIYDIEDRSNPTAKGLASIAGCMTRVNQRFIPWTFHGKIELYSNNARGACKLGTLTKNKEAFTSWEYTATFTEGKLTDLKGNKKVHLNEKVITEEEFRNFIKRKEGMI